MGAEGAERPRGAQGLTPCDTECYVGNTGAKSLHHTGSMKSSILTTAAGTCLGILATVAIIGGGLTILTSDPVNNLLWNISVQMAPKS